MNDSQQKFSKLNRLRVTRQTISAHCGISYRNQSFNFHYKTSGLFLHKTLFLNYYTNELFFKEIESLLPMKTNS